MRTALALWLAWSCVGAPPEPAPAPAPTTPVAAPPVEPPRPPVGVDDTRFELRASPRGGVVLHDRTTDRRLPLSERLFVEAEPGDFGPTAENLFEKVLAFEVGDGRLALQTVVYAVSENNHFGAGKYVFFLLEPEAGSPVVALVEPIDRSRVGDLACRPASHAITLAADIDGDGQSELGLIRERVTCDADGQHLHQAPIAWYRAESSRWEPTVGAAIPPEATELPLLLGASPIDHAWQGRPAPQTPYVPAYRKAKTQTR